MFLKIIIRPKYSYLCSYLILLLGQLSWLSLLFNCILRNSSNKKKLNIIKLPISEKLHRFKNNTN